ALRQYLIPRATFDALRFTLRVNEDLGWEETLERLYALGYERTDVVSAVGEYAVRGGILDVFAASQEHPTRVEFFGDTVESIRPFEIASQRSEGFIDA